MEKNLGNPSKSNAKTSSVELCILHDQLTANNGNFVSFISCKGDPDEKLRQLHEICELRMNQPVNSCYRMKNICEQVPLTLDGLCLEKTGYHRACYAKFTGNLTRLRKKCTSTYDEESVPQVKHSSREHKPSKAEHDEHRSTFLFPAECIFCNKVRLKIKGTTESLIKFASWKNRDPPWKNIESRAREMKKDSLHCKVQGHDLFAVEAQYHASCRNAFNTEYKNYVRRNKEPQMLEDPSNNQAKLTAVHSKAYQKVKDYVAHHVIDRKEVVRGTKLRDIYADELEKCDFPSLTFRNEKIYRRLKKDQDISEEIAFSKVAIRGCVETNLVYNSRITLDEAISNAFELASTNEIKDVALTLHSIIQKAFKESEDLPWPPTVHDLNALKMDELFPSELVEFMAVLLNGTSETSGEMSEKNRRLVYSITQDVCRCVTNGQWKLPKHILLCAALRHLYRSKQMTTILSRLGHSETYNYSLELETAMAKALDECSTHLTPQIITGERNIVFHSEWDNLNKITTNIHGSNIVNSAGGIMMQEVKEGPINESQRTLPSFGRSKQVRSFKVDPPESLPELSFKRIGPKFPVDAKFTPPTENEAVYNSSLSEYYVYILCRYTAIHCDTLFPGFGGFVSSTGKQPANKTTIDYYTPISQPITDNAVVYELLKRSEAATKEVGQPYTINTFDLGVVMKACPIVWKYEEEFRKHIVIPGKFHTVMNYMGMLTGHKCKGSGYSEILIESGLATSGCLKSILSGKSYARAMFSLKAVTDALEQLLLDVFLAEESVNIPCDALKHLIHCSNRDNLNIALDNELITDVIERYIQFQKKVRNGHLGKTAIFWLSVIDHARNVFMMDFAVKTNNFVLFHHCNGVMAELFFAYDGHNYSRYLTWFEAFLTNIEITHPGASDYIKNGAISVARSMIPGALSAVDKTMEETFMKFAKSSGGLLGIFNMSGTFKKWCRTTSARAQLYESTLEMCDMIQDPDCPRAGTHRELDSAQVKKYSETVLRVKTTIKDFTDPFVIPDKARLFSIASGAPIEKDVETDVLRAEALGKAAKVNFVDERFKSGKKDFFDRVKKSKLKTMDYCNKKIRLTSSQGKLVVYREQSNLAFQLLVKSQTMDAPPNLEELMSYPLSPVPHALGSPDGFFAKTNKAAVLHYLLQDETTEVTLPSDALYIQDGNALFHSLTNMPQTFGDICLQMLKLMSNRQSFVFSTDSYDASSIKAQERLRRGYTDEYIISGPHTRKPHDFKAFLGNDENKKQLSSLLLKVWSSDRAAALLSKCHKSIICVEGKAYDLSVENDHVCSSEITELQSDQEETDSRVVLYLQQAVQWGYKSSVVKTPDTDILMILLYHADKLKITTYLDYGSGVHRKLINVSELASSLGSDYCEALLGFYVFSGEDCTSAFKGKGKVAPLKKLEKYPKYQKAFKQLGNTWEIPDELLDQLEAFTCLMYGYPKMTSINAVRVRMLQKMVGSDKVLDLKSKVDLERLPPPRVCLIPHLQRCNYRVACYKRADVARQEKPDPSEPGMGWIKNTEEHALEPLWSIGPILPSSLIDLLVERHESEVIANPRYDNDDEFDDDEIDVDNFISDVEEDEEESNLDY